MRNKLVLYLSALWCLSTLHIVSSVVYMYSGACHSRILSLLQKCLRSVPPPVRVLWVELQKHVFLPLENWGHFRGTINVKGKLEYFRFYFNESIRTTFRNDL